jgi:ubiquinone/menaquinone biosynthesis C-methylase UbiE
MTDRTGENLLRLARFAGVGVCPGCHKVLRDSVARHGSLLCDVCHYRTSVDAGVIVALPVAESERPSQPASTLLAAGWAAGIVSDMDAKSDSYVDKYQRRTRASRAFFIRLEHAMAMAGHHPGRILEAGCGPGVISPLLSRRGVETHGVDLSLGQLRTAVMRDPGTVYVQGDLRRLPYADSAFDAIALLGVFEYVEQPETVLRELARTLKSGGRLIITVPNAHGIERIWTHYVYLPVARLARRLLGRSVPAYSRRLYTLKSLTMFLGQAGLLVEEARFFDVVLAPPPLDKVFGNRTPACAEVLERRLRGRTRRALCGQIIALAAGGKS